VEGAALFPLSPEAVWTGPGVLIAQAHHFTTPCGDGRRTLAGNGRSKSEGSKYRESLALPQAVSGKQNLTPYILWLGKGLKTRESSGSLIPAQKYFWRFLITTRHAPWDSLGIRQVDSATLAHDSHSRSG